MYSPKTQVSDLLELLSHPRALLIVGGITSSRIGRATRTDEPDYLTAQDILPESSPPALIVEQVVDQGVA